MWWSYGTGYTSKYIEMQQMRQRTYFVYQSLGYVIFAICFFRILKSTNIDVQDADTRFKKSFLARYFQKFRSSYFLAILSFQTMKRNGNVQRSSVRTRQRAQRSARCWPWFKRRSTSLMRSNPAHRLLRPEKPLLKRYSEQFSLQGKRKEKWNL